VNAVEGLREPRRTSISLSTSRYFAFVVTVASYPVGYFGRNQLLGGSMGLSPLYEVETSNLHVSTATIFHWWFLNASISPRKDHHLSGLSTGTFARSHQKWPRPVLCPAFRGVTQMNAFT